MTCAKSAFASRAQTPARVAWLYVLKDPFYVTAVDAGALKTEKRGTWVSFDLGERGVSKDSEFLT